MRYLFHFQEITTGVSRDNNIINSQESNDVLEQSRREGKPFPTFVLSFYTLF